jgi:hypothetical protein
LWSDFKPVQYMLTLKKPLKWREQYCNCKSCVSRK